MSQPVFRPTVAGGYQWVIPNDPAVFERFRLIAGSSCASSWSPVEVALLQTDEAGHRRREADLPWMGDFTLVLTPLAREVLGELLETSGELLPLSCEGAQLYAFNPLVVIDALDHERSVVTRLTSGRVVRIDRHSFHADRVQGVHVFKLPEMLRGSLYVSDTLVERITEARLMGTSFEEVWRSGDPA